MPNSIVPTPLYRIEECPDLMADACVCDDSRSLIVLSVWGRDTAVHEFLGRLTLGSQKDGLTDLHLIADDHLSIPVFVGDVDRFEKRTTRSFQRTLFGSLVHLWIFDKRCTRPDKANGIALAVIPKAAPNPAQRLWMLVRETCPLPLLNHWQNTVMALLQSQAMLVPLELSVGPLQGYRLALGLPVLTSALGDLIRTDVLGTEPIHPVSAEPLRHVA